MDEDCIVNLQHKPNDLEVSRSEHASVQPHAAPADQGAATPHRSPAAAVVSMLGSDAARGLTRAEAELRLAHYGLNQLKSAPETPWWKRLAEQFENFLVIILLVATVISVLEWLLQDPRESALP
jgi:magnesium-transporting ATPase (P-type)